jgi:putative transposase
MARLARVVVPGHPHHVTQRGNGRARTFFGDGDYALYRDLLAAHCGEAAVEVWAWCLMPNQLHLILVPSDPDDSSQVGNINTGPSSSGGDASTTNTVNNK